MTPLPDTSFGWPDEYPVHAVLSVRGQLGDRRHSLAVPSFVPIDAAIGYARSRGWSVLGVWKCSKELGQRKG